MKRIHSALLALAATLAIAATTALAQSPVTLKATIPFSFQAGGKAVMQPGDYRISHNAGIWRFTSLDNRQDSMAVASLPMQSDLNDTPRLVFVCQTAATHCALKSIYGGHGEPAGYWAQPNDKSGNEEARLVVIPVTVAE
jgi:hypothetical protein